jgi:hypothetical protein
VKDEHNIQVPVRFNDIVYAAHGIALGVLFALQWFLYRSKVPFFIIHQKIIYPTLNARALSCRRLLHRFCPPQRCLDALHIKRMASVVLAYAILWFCIAIALLAAQLRLVSLASVVALIGSGKALISLFKYAPQVSHHRQLKSADEWNFASLLLDLGGGVGALLQVLLDAWIAGHVDEITVR